MIIKVNYHFLSFVFLYQLAAEISASNYWRLPFKSLCTYKQFTEYMVLQIEPVDSKNLSSSTTNLSQRVSEISVYMNKNLAVFSTILLFKANIPEIWFERVKLNPLSTSESLLLILK